MRTPQVPALPGVTPLGIRPYFGFLHRRRGGGWELTITRDVQMHDIVQVQHPANKWAARRACAEVGAIPHNF